ncbi:dephospho-CoA kinase [Staphylococcus lutrae]|uniref:Dephospho-CoA kinase n=1 Tax=Staphylococcus lutrae TaxID=155085 RepID=A0AAC9WIQ0_9STAP|nr:dephospho-CoA kinase [Staphylococcus lutrae]ARJ49981.1 dephospho-CoA kinase [Staphylococcus lutrae]PNZ38913.1 dephospho-CoA kinase [Staphylococcus lutrae]
MPKVIGLTGGIATGKSTVAELLAIHGFKIVDADVAARKAVAKGSEGLKKVHALFGDEAITEDGEMNRVYVGSQVFYDDEKRNQLNAIVHPYVKEMMSQERDQYLSEGYDVIMDIPLLFENGLEETVDEVWLVYASEPIQIDRLMARNQLTIEDAKARIYSQISIDKKSRMADVVIDNLGTKLELKQNLERVLADKGYLTPHHQEEI